MDYQLYCLGPMVIAFFSLLTGIFVGIVLSLLTKHSTVRTASLVLGALPGSILGFVLILVGYIVLYQIWPAMRNFALEYYVMLFTFWMILYLTSYSVTLVLSRKGRQIIVIGLFRIQRLRSVVMWCPHCGKETNILKDYCEHCHKKLTDSPSKPPEQHKHCSHCGASNSLNATSCSNCHRAL